MRESIGATWLFGLVAGFTMIFVGYLCIMINYSTVFKNKNEVVSIVEKYEGLQDTDNGSVKIINDYLRNSNYNSTGKCVCTNINNCYGLPYNPTKNREENISGQQLELVKNNKNGEYYWCAEYHSSGNVGEEYGYYDVQLFLNIDVPVLNSLGKFRVKGETIKIKHIKDYKN